ncbi:O-antigen ligase family protein [Kordiimonas sp.]|uniref:O-antigen ligase family protein n=1 Tax=Kordiimonas sp. TaxID=1970157 RepID=UPI003A9485BE
MKGAIFIILGLAPIALGSVKPVFLWFWAIIISLMLMGEAAAGFRHTSRAVYLIETLKRMRMALFVVFGLLVFLLVQYMLAPDLSVYADPMTRIAENVYLPQSFVPKETLKAALWICGTSIFFLLCINTGLRDRQFATQVVAFITLVGTALSIYGLGAYLQDSNSILWFEGLRIPHTGLSSTFVNRNNFATFCGLVLLANMDWLRRFIRLAKGSEKGLLPTIRALVGPGGLLVVALLVNFSALAFAGSRGAIAATVVACGVYMFMQRGLRGPAQYSTIVRRLAVSLGVMGLVFVFLLLSGAGHRFTLDLSQSPRVHIYQTVFEAMAQRPVFGYGLGTFEQIFPLFRPPEIHQYFRRAHSEYLEMIWGLGLVPFLALMAFGVCGLVRLWQMSSSHLTFAISFPACMLVMAHGLIDFPIQIPAILFVFLALLSVDISLFWRRSKPQEKIRKRGVE